MARNKLTLLAALLLTSVAAHSQVLLNRFGPVSGVLVGTAGSPETAAATIATLQPILSTTPGLVLNGAAGGSKGAGTINATGLYVNGSAVGVGGGAVSSVSISVPTPSGGCWGTSGNPVTSSGTLGVTLSGTTAEVLLGNGACANNIAGPFSVGAGATTASNNPFSVLAGARGTGANFIALQDSTGTKADIGYATGNDDLYFYDIPAATIRLGTSNIDRVDITPVGGLVINTPSSGVAQVVNTVSGQKGIDVFSSSGAASDFFIGWNVGVTANAWNIISQSTDPITFGTEGAASLNLITSGANRITINSSGNVTVAAPASGIGFTGTGSIAVTSTGGGSFYSLLNGALGFADICLNTKASGAECVVGDAPDEVSLRGAVGHNVHIGDESGDDFLDIGSASVTAAGSLFTGSVISATGNVATPASGLSTDLQVSGGEGFITAFNHSTPAGAPLVIRGSTVSMLTGAAVNVSGFVQGTDGGVTIGAPTGGDKGVGTINAVAVYVNGTAVTNGFRTAALYAFCSSSSCSINDAYGVSAVTRNSTGNYQVTFSPTFSSTPACTAMGANNESMGAGAIYNTTNVTITMTSGGTSHDDSFFMTCIGS